MSTDNNESSTIPRSLTPYAPPLHYQMPIVPVHGVAADVSTVDTAPPSPREDQPHTEPTASQTHRHNGLEGSELHPSQTSSTAVLGPLVHASEVQANETAERLSDTSTPAPPQSPFEKFNYQPGFTIYAPPPRKETHLASHASLYFPSGLQVTLHHPHRTRDPSSFSPINSPKPDTLSPESYRAFFESRIEKEYMSQQRFYDGFALYSQRIQVMFVPSNQETTLLHIPVPSLLDDTPTFEVGDLIELRQIYPGNSYHASRPPCWAGIIYEARIAAINKSAGMLSVDVNGLRENTFGATHHLLRPETPEMFFNVRFRYSATHYPPMCLALDSTQQALDVDAQAQFGAEMRRHPAWLRSMLFPAGADVRSQMELGHLPEWTRFFAENLNEDQARAVMAVCNQSYGTRPYLVSGPPGTGKTKTIIEIAVQLVRNSRGNSHVLLCAPSEVAADKLILRLSSHFSTSELLRLNRPTRDLNSIARETLDFCCRRRDHSSFCLPSLQELLAYRVVVTSCLDAILLLDTRVTNLDMYGLYTNVVNALRPLDGGPSDHRMHWTALLIDDAAQATELEALMPISVVAPPDIPWVETAPIVVMAGDEQQPISKTSLPSSPLKRSLFSRLIFSPVYAKQPSIQRNSRNGGSGGPSFEPALTKLTRNYRSNPAILAVPSALFYHDTLEPEAQSVDRLADWDGWCGRRWPVLFHNNIGGDREERDGRGWHNPSKSRIALSYATWLQRTERLQSKKIYILSPFEAQVRYLRQAAHRSGFRVLRSDECQGFNCGVVILCTTRATKGLVEKDRAEGRGVVGMRNAMNMAMTRAMYGLIVIGSADVLGTDPN